MIEYKFMKVLKRKYTDRDKLISDLRDALKIDDENKKKDWEEMQKLFNKGIR